MSTVTAVPEVEKRETAIQAQKRMRSRHCNLSNAQIVHYLRLAFDDRIGSHIGHFFCINNEDAENMLRSERAELWLQAFTDVARYLRTIDRTYLSETEVLDAVGIALGIRQRGNCENYIDRLIAEAMTREMKQ